MEAREISDKGLDEIIQEYEQIMVARYCELFPDTEHSVMYTRFIMEKARRSEAND